MDILVYLIPGALLLGGMALAAFFWSLNSDQYEDLDGAANRILIDEEVEMVEAQTHTVDRYR